MNVMSGRPALLLTLLLALAGESPRTDRAEHPHLRQPDDLHLPGDLRRDRPRRADGHWRGAARRDTGARADSHGGGPLDGAGRRAGGGGARRLALRLPCRRERSRARLRRDHRGGRRQGCAGAPRCALRGPGAAFGRACSSARSSSPPWEPLVAAGLLWLFIRGRRMALAGVAKLSRTRTFRISGVDFAPILRSGIRAALFVLFWALVLSAGRGLAHLRPVAVPAHQALGRCAPRERPAPAGQGRPGSRRRAPRPGHRGGHPPDRARRGQLRLQRRAPGRGGHGRRCPASTRRRRARPGGSWWAWSG